MAKTKFGAVSSPTPMWAKWFFRISLYFISLIILALTTLNVDRFGIQPQDVNDLVAALSLLIMAIHSFTRMFGIEIEPEEYQIK